MMTPFRARGAYRYALPILSLCAAFAAGAGCPQRVTSDADAARSPSGSIGSSNGPLLVIDQRGERGAQVQLGAGHDEILSVQGGAVHRLLGGLTASCCGLGGLAPSPRGRYIVFSQETLYRSGHAMPTAGLWRVASTGTGLTRLFPPPAPNRAEELSVGAAAWSPDRYTLAYAVNLYTDAVPVAPFLLKNSGIWLARYDGVNQRLPLPFAPNGRYAHFLTVACGHGPYNPIVTALAWTPDGRKLVASANCLGSGDVQTDGRGDRRGDGTGASAGAWSA